MTELEPRHSKEEFARRGRELYQQQIGPGLGPENEGRFVAIDIESGDFALDDDDYRATELLLAKRPDAQIWLERVGYPTAYRIRQRVPPLSR